MATTEAVVLPTNVLPSKYTLKLQPDLKNFTYEGEETIDIEVSEATAQIQLNSEEVEIQSARLIRDGQSTPTSSIDYDKKTEVVTLSSQFNIWWGKGLPC